MRSRPFLLSALRSGLFSLRRSGGLTFYPGSQERNFSPATRAPSLFSLLLVGVELTGAPISLAWSGCPLVRKGPLESQKRATSKFCQFSVKYTTLERSLLKSWTRCPIKYNGVFVVVAEVCPLENRTSEREDRAIRTRKVTPRKRSANKKLAWVLYMVSGSSSFTYWPF